jgi:hypothetical protein
MTLTPFTGSTSLMKVVPISARPSAIERATSLPRLPSTAFLLTASAMPSRSNIAANMMPPEPPAFGSV